jgi:streptogramin lyase
MSLPERCARLSSVACSEVLVAAETCKERQCAVVRLGHIIAVVGVFLTSVVMVGCGGVSQGNTEGRDGQRGAATTSSEETTAPEADRPTAGTTREPVGLDEKVVSPTGQADLPVGFGEDSLWATDTYPSVRCDDVIDVSTSASASDSASATSEGLCAVTASAEPAKTLLKRVDPRTGEEVAAIPLLKDLSGGFMHVAFGAGSVWFSSSNDAMGPAPKRGPGDVVLRIDPEKNRIVDRIPVDPPSGLAFGHGSVWVTSASYGTVSRIDPQTDKVVAEIKVGRGAGDIAADERSGAVWVASAYLAKDPSGYDTPQYSEDRNLTRIDPATNRVVAQIPIRANSLFGGADNVAVGEGALWASSEGKLFKVDPAANEVTAMVSLGGNYASHLVVYGGGVWAMVQVKEVRLMRVDPRTMDVVASEEIGPIPEIGPGGLAAGGGYVWYSSLDGLARVEP